MKKSFFVLLIIMMSAMFSGCGSSDATDEVVLVVGAAASLTDVMQELAVIYERDNANVTLEFTFASSGALQTQIEQGAPIDVFMSAAPLQMNNLVEQGLIHGESRNLLRNAIALIVPEGNPAGINTFADLATDAASRIGLGDPETVPGGTRAREIFTTLGIDESIYGSGREVLAPDIRTVLSWVEMGEVDAGVVFMTDAISSDRIEVVEIADPSLHGPSVNPVGIVYGSGNIQEAELFIDFLFTPAAAVYFEQHGFSMYQSVPVSAPIEREPNDTEPVELIIGAAMGLMDATEELAVAWQALNPHVSLTFTYASSGALRAQIEEGAPIDVFMSAAALEMRELEEQGLLYGTGRPIVTNVPVLIVRIDSGIELTGFEDIALDTVGMFAMGDPATTPLGRIGESVFDALGIAEVAASKTVLASDVRQVLTWVEMGEADVGLVWMSDAISSPDVEVVAVADPALHTPVVFPSGIIETSDHKEQAQAFIDFLLSDTAQGIFERHGFAALQ